MSASSHHKICLTFVVKMNLFWRNEQPNPLRNFTITSIDQDEKHFWFTVDCALDFKQSECLISVHNLPGLAGQKQVESATPGQSRCSIKSTQKFTSQDLQSMQQACNTGLAYLSQDTKIDYSTELHLYEIESCNGSGTEVKDPQMLKAWLASLNPANMPAPSLNGQHEPQQSIMDNQETQQATPPRHQPFVVLPSQVLSSPHKRSRISSGWDEEPQASFCVLLLAMLQPWIDYIHLPLFGMIDLQIVVMCTLQSSFASEYADLAEQLAALKLEVTENFDTLQGQVRLLQRFHVVQVHV